MALSRLRIEAQKERTEEEKKRREAAGQTIGEASRLRQEAQKEQEAKKAAGIPTSLPTFSELRESGSESLRNREILQSVSRNANRNPVTTQTPDDSDEQMRDANLKDILWNSLKQGYYNSRYGEESYDRMMGVDNEADKYRDILSGDDYRFRTDNAFEQAVSGAMTQIGQMARQYTNPRSLGMATAAGGAALLAGQAGPQVLAPEELLTVPGAMALGFQTGSAMSNFEIEGGLAYQEMLDLGVSPETARVIGLAVGGGNAALDALQLDELMDGLKVAKKTGGMDNAAGVIWDVIKKRFPGVANNVAQEVGQEGVTIGGAQLGSLIDKGEFAYDAGEVVNRLGDTALSSMLTFSALDVPGASMNVAAQLNANKQYSKIGSDYQSSADDLVNEGLSFAPESEAYQTAQEVKTKMDAGQTVTDAELGRVVVANERTMQAEERLERANRPVETLEEVAHEAVQAERGVSVESDTSPTPIEMPVREAVSAKESVPYNVMAESNPVRQAMMAKQKGVQETTGYGKHGASTFANIVETTNTDPGKVRMEFQSAYEAGLTNLPREHASLRSSIQEEAYNAGRLDYIADMSKPKSAAVVRKDAGFGRANLPKDVTEAQYKAVDMLAKAAGVKVRMAKGLKGNAEIAADGTVLIDETFQRKVNGQKRSIVFYAAHEIGMHRLMQLAPSEGRAFINAVIRDANSDLAYGTATVTEKRQAAYAEQDVYLDTASAMEEVAADSILGLYDSEEAFYQAIDRIVNGKDEQAKNGARKFKEILDDIVRKLKKAIAKLTGKERAEAQQTLTEVEQLRGMYEKALEAAVKRAKAVAESENGTKNVVRVGDEGATYEENGKVYSLKSLQHDITEGKMFDDLVAAKVFTRKEADLLKENLTKLISYMIPNANILDMNEEYTKDNRPFSSYKPNSDPLYIISLDFSTLCRKRLMTQYVIEQLQLKENRPMSAEEQIAIRSMLLDYRQKEKALQVACAMCYVEAARLKAPKQIERFFNDTESIMRKHFAKKDKEFNAKVVEAQKRFKVEHGYDENAPKKDMKSKDQKALNDMSAKMRKEYVPGAEQQTIIDTAVKLPRSKFLTAANLTELSIDHPEIYDAYTSHIRASTRSKSLEGDVPYYYGDSRGKVTDSFIDSVNAENGMRFDSWSDFQMKHMLDMITAVIDLSVRGSKMHGYTKFPEMVRIFGKTGMMFNLSGVTDGNGFNADGSLRFSDTESIDIKQAIQLRNDFPETAGLQCIGVSDDHIRALLRADYIDYVIPYHTSGMNATLRRMAGIHKWKDYTKTQHATKDPKAKKPEGAVNWQVEPVWSEYYVADGKDGIDIMKKTAQRYIDMCHERGLIPKFDEFTDEDGYWKLLVDRKMVNQKTGKIIEQQAVKPIFDFDLIQREIDNEVSQYDPALEKRALKYVVDNFDAVHQRIRDLKKGHPKKPMLKMANEILQAYAEGSKRSEPVTVQSAATEATDGNMKYSLRTKPDPKKTIEVYKLMRLENGAIKPLFIDSTEELTPGLWYDADSPNLDFLKRLPSGIFLVDANRETYTTFDEYLAKSGERKTKYPSKKAIEKAASEGKRWVYIEDVVDKSGKPKQQRRYGGETRKYWNLGINGSGAVNLYAMRPGYHAGSLPTMRQIGKGPNKDLRDDTFVWTVGEVPADIDYQAEANRNPDKDIPTHIPVDGYYLKATNADKAKSQADVMGWYVAGSYKINRIISDAEARSIIDKWNAEHPDAQALYDYERESGMDFDADQMKLVPKADKKYSMKDSNYLSAVERGDMETAQRMVAAFARESGYTPVKRYHQTAGGFTKFSTDNPRAGLHDSETPNGIFFKDNDHDIGLEGKTQLQVYLKADNMLHFHNREEANKWYCDNVAVYATLQDEYNAALKPFLDELDEIEKKMFDSATTDDEYDALSEREESIIEEMREVEDSYRGQLRELLNEHFLNGTSGYDGIELDYDGHRWVNGKRENVHTYIVFNPAQAKSADPVTYDDAGNVIPLSKRFDSSNEDIRFSLKEHNDLLRENAKLKEVNQDLREQFKTTTFAKVDKKALRDFSKQLLKDYSSGADIDATRDALDGLYTYLANGEDGMTPSWNDAYKRAYEVAVSVLENASVLDDEMWVQYKDLRDRLRTVGVSISSEYSHDLAGYENLQDFRRRNAGRIKLVKGGTPVDVVYQDLANTYPDLFDADEYINPADQLVHIADVLEEMRPVEINPYRHEMREAATWLANDIMERFFELPQAKPTFADKAERKLTDQVIKDTKKLEKLRAEKNEKIAKIIEENREKVKNAVTGERMVAGRELHKLKKKYAEKEAKASESKKANALRAKILRHTGNLKRDLFTNSDKHHVPDDMRLAVEMLLDSINLESKYEYVFGKDGKYHRVEAGTELGAEPTKRTEAFRELRKVYKTLMETDAGDVVIDPDIMDVLERVIDLSDIPISAMNSTQLDSVWQAVRIIEHACRTAGKMLSKAKYERTVEWADAIVHDTRSRKSKKGKLAEKLRIDLENPYTFFSHYGEAGKAIFRMLRDAQDAQQLMVEQVAAEVKKIVNPKTARKWEREIHEFTTERGVKLTLTGTQCMEIYELMKREQALDHLMKGGIVQPEIKHKKIKRGTDAILLTHADVTNIIKVLTDEQVKVADALQQLTCTTLAGFGNEASMKAYGYKKFTGTDYWPIKSAKEAIHSNVEKGGNNTRSIKNIGLAKSVIPHASNPLDIAGVFKTFAAHAGDMTDYAAWLCPMEDANRLYNFQFRDDMGRQTGRTMKGLLDRVGGKGAKEYWHNLMEDIQNGLAPTNDSAFLEPINKVIGNVKGASVGANIRVVVQQPTAIIRAAMVLSPADMLKGMVSGGGWKKALEWSSIAKRKDMGGFDISSPMQMGEILFDSKTGLERFNEAMMVPAGVADAVTWGRIWNACESNVKRKQPGLKGDAFYEAVAEVFAEVIDQSQVVDGVLQRSQTMRSGNALMKQATAFMGEPTMALNMLLRAYDAFANETDANKRGKAIKTFGRAATVLLVTNVVNALAQSLVDAARDDEDEEYWEKFWNAFYGVTGDEESAWDKASAAVLSGNLGSSLNPVGYVPVAKDVLSILQGYNVTRADADVMGDIISASQTFMDSLTGDGKKTLPYATKNLAQQIGKVFGVSAPNILRDVWGIMRTIAVETDNVALMYEMEKAIYKIDNSGNRSRFVDILYRAYHTDKAAFDKIRADMLNGDYFKSVNDDGKVTTTADYIASGLKSDLMDDLFALYKDDQAAYKAMYSDLIKRDFLKTGVKTNDPETNTFVSTADAIASAMESRMKKDQGVKKVSDLKQRYLAPNQQTVYDKKLKSMKGNDLWSKASAKQRDDVEDKLYGIVTGRDKDTLEKLSAGSSFGLDDTEYLLYSLALDMVDQPNDNGKLGTYNNAEKAAAILELDMGDSETAFLWDTDQGYEAFADGVDMGHYVEFKAGVAALVPGEDYKKGDTDSRKRAIKLLLRDMGLDSGDSDYKWLWKTEYKK